MCSHSLHNVCLLGYSVILIEEEKNKTRIQFIFWYQFLNNALCKYTVGVNEMNL